ncbi:phage tail protein [Frankia sp. AgKG'84/4]|uniref:phage tail protein n=1 Tax=Frankia sp. AgKG'84/4 TaxID=573490 RepID=UPI00200C5A52|nr:phage tail protein [Frankia sp. AgKG'84/4]MCL9795937.1 phage tail protein [Frankia sp. AgKG'84/4]
MTGTPGEDERAGRRGRRGRAGADQRLTSPFPLAAMLPAVYAQDDLAGRFTEALDDLVAPLIVALDCFDAYLAPALAPIDFAIWLGSWVGAELTGEETDAALRAAVGAAARLHRLRGTARGIAEAVRLSVGVTPDVLESGAASWSAGPPGPFSAAGAPGLTVRLRVADPASIDLNRLHRLVDLIRPAHVPYTVQVLDAEPPNQRHQRHGQ